MAYSVPESLARTATRGERLVFQTLKDCLPDDYIVYYEPMIHAACVLPEENLGSNNGKESQAQITVSNFHHWLTSHLKTPIERLAELLEKIERKEAIIPTYDAVLIDEGQDFEPEWLKLITRVLNPSTQSLLLVEDRAQNIFRRKTSFAQDIGLDFRGRSRVLSINYRNTR